MGRDEDNKLMYRRLMCNYFSVGIESRIGMGFEKKRTGSACCNKTKYFQEGLKKMFGCCTKTLKIKEIIEYVSAVDFEGNDKVLFASSKTMQTERYLSKILIMIGYRWRSCFFVC